MEILPPGEGLPERRAPMARSSYEARIRELRAAAEEWGIRSSTPEGAVISALIGTIAELGELSDSIAADMGEIVRAAERVACAKLGTVELEIEKLRVSLANSAAIFDKARAGLANVDMAREHLAKKVAIDMSTDILAAMKPHMGAAIIIKQRQQHWRAYGFAGLAALGFVVVGIVFGVWASAGPSLAQESIDLCASAPYFSPDGNAWCNLRHLPHISAQAATAAPSLAIAPATLR